MGNTPSGISDKLTRRYMLDIEELLKKPEITIDQQIHLLEIAAKLNEQLAKHVTKKERRAQQAKKAKKDIFSGKTPAQVDTSILDTLLPE